APLHDEVHIDTKSLAESCGFGLGALQISNETVIVALPAYGLISVFRRPVDTNLQGIRPSGYSFGPLLAKEASICAHDDRQVRIRLGCATKRLGFVIHQWLAADDLERMQTGERVLHNIINKRGGDSIWPPYAAFITH